jgi:hypothetical protein
MRESINEKRRDELQRRAATGTPLESYRWGKLSSAADAPAATARESNSAAPAPSPTATTCPIEPPPLSSAPDAVSDEALHAEVDVPATGPGAPLVFPLQGAAARQEWQHAGERRAMQADRALCRESGRGGAHPEVSTAGRTLILAGQGSYLGVEGGALVAHQGRTHGAPAPARELLYPALHGVRCILWVGAHGHQTDTITLASAAWCRAEGIALTVLDDSRKPLLVTLPEERYDAQLHRQQWAISLGISEPQAGVIVREVLRRKVAGQYATFVAHADLPGYDAAFAQFTTWRGG